MIKHRAKSDINSVNKSIDLFFTLGKPSFEDFRAYLVGKFDFEILTGCLKNVEEICLNYSLVLKMIDSVEEFVAPLRSIPRKEAAAKIIEAYKDPSIAFSVLTGKVNDSMIKKMLESVL